MNNIEKLEKIARAFRDGLEKNASSDSPGFLSGFPDGCCNWASYMIGHFIKYECGLEPVEIQAERYFNESDSHSWLMVNDITIDITSDEFYDSNDTVVVKVNSPWHEAWNIVRREEIRSIEFFDKVDHGSKYSPSEYYELIAKEVRKSCT